MQNGQISMTLDEMEQRASDFRSVRDEVQDCVTRMDNLTTQLNEEWNGSASAAYCERFESDLKPSFLDAVDLIDQIASALDAARQAVSETDDSIASQLRG